MDPKKWREIERIFEDAQDLSVDKRKSYLDKACAGDDALRAEVESLLNVGEDDLAFLSEPIFDSGLKEGKRLGPYVIHKKLGQGGMGTVYLAEQTEGVKRLVAVKFIGTLGFDEDRKKRFEVEQHLLARMSHSHIAKLYETGITDEGYPYFVMEYIDGLPITHFCDEHHLSIGERLHLFSKVCAAIGHAHLKGIIHRDIKPSNILVIMENQVPTPKIIDFGIAKTLDGAETLTRQDNLPGTLRYMSPEQAGLTDPGGNRMDPDFRTDVYNLGLLLYEMLVGVTPLNLETRSPEMDVCRQICLQTPKKPSQRWSKLNGPTSRDYAAKRGVSNPRGIAQKLSGDLDWIVLKALEKQPDRRYQTAHEMRRDLERHISHLPIEAKPPSPLYVLRKFMRRNRLAVGGVVTLVLLTIVFITSLAISRRQTILERDRAERERDSAQHITELMIDMFRANDPFNGTAGDLTVKQVLDRASERIPHQLENEPETKVRMMRAIADVYYHLGHYDQGIYLLEQNLEMMKKLYGEKDLSVAEAKRRLAEVLEAKGGYDRSERLYREALARQQALLGQDHPETVQTMSSMGNMFVAAGKVVEADDILTQALVMQRKSPKGVPYNIGDTINALAVLCRERGDYERAVRFFSESLRIQQERNGDRHPNVATAINNLAATYHAQGQFDKAEPLYRQALQIKRLLLGENHPAIANSLNNLAVLLQDKGEDVAAEQMLRDALAIRRAQHEGPNYPLAKNLVNLGRQLNINGHTEQAEEMVTEAIAMFVSLFGPGHHEQGNALNNLGVIYRTQNRPDDAERAYRDAMHIYVESFGPEHLHVGVSLMGLAGVEMDRGDFQKGEGFARQSLTVLEKKFPDGHWIVDKGKGMLGRCLLGQKRYEEAEVLLVDAFEGLYAQFGDVDGFVESPLRSLIELYKITNNQEKASYYQAKLAGDPIKKT